MEDNVITLEEALVELMGHSYGHRYKWMLYNSGKSEMDITLKEAIKLACIYESCKEDGQR